MLKVLVKLLLEAFNLGITTVKPVLSGHSKRRPKLVFKTDYRLMQVKSIAERDPWVCSQTCYQLRYAAWCL